MGDQYQYLLLKSKERFTEQGGSIKTSVETDISIMVQNKAEDFYTIEWRVGESRILEGPDSESASAQAFANLMQGTKIKLRIDRRGVIHDVLNFISVRDEIESTLDTLLSAQVAAEEISEHDAAQFKASSMTLYNSKDALVYQSLPEVNIFFAAHGYEVSEDFHMAFDAEVPNPLGGKVFPANGRVALISVDEEAGALDVNWSQTVDRNKHREILLQSLVNIAQQQEAPAPSLEQIPPPILQTSADYRFQLGTMKVLTIDYTFDTDLVILKTRESVKFTARD